MPKQQNENEETKEIKIEQKKQLSNMMEEGDAPTFYIDEKLNLERADYSQEEKSSSFYHYMFPNQKEKKNAPLALKSSEGKVANMPKVLEKSSKMNFRALNLL